MTRIRALNWLLLFAVNFAEKYGLDSSDGCLALIREVGSTVITKISVNVFIGLAGNFAHN